MLSALEAINLTKKSKEDKEQSRTMRFVTAREEAIQEIIKDCDTKIRKAALNGEHFAELYSFEWVEDPSQKYDATGTKIIFSGDVRVRDILTKDRINLFNDLEKILNKDNTSTDARFYCYDRSPNKQHNRKWSIYVAWKTKDEHIAKSKYVKKTKSTQDAL